MPSGRQKAVLSPWQTVAIIVLVLAGGIAVSLFAKCDALHDGTVPTVPFERHTDVPVQPTRTW